ncbi:MAG: sugar phosphate isomerase/epimerase family protein [Suipraeoptans sp.]
MLIGARTHDFGIGEALKFEEKLELIKNIGYETIQLAPAKALDEIPDIHSIEEKHIDSIKKILYKVGLPVSVLGCYIEPSINDKDLRLRNVDTFCKNIKYAKILGAKIVGTETTHFPMSDLDNREKAYENLKDSVQRMAEVAEKEDIFIGVEPVAEHTINNSEIMRRLIDEVDSEKLKVILDPANLILPNKINKQRKIFKEAIDQLGDYVVAVHAKNFVIVNGKKQMVSLEEGVIDFADIGNWVKENKSHISILRENSSRVTDKKDIALMKELFIESNYLRNYFLA